MGKRKPSIAILHYSCPPVIGGVEVVIEAHAKLLVDAGYHVRLIVGKGGQVHPKVKTIEIPELVASGGPLAKELKALSQVRVPKTFDACVARVETKLAAALKGVDVCMTHNVLTMHFNMVFTAALANIMARPARTHFVGWTHDLSFSDPRYAPYCQDEYPWSLLKTELPGCKYCVISKQRQRFSNRILGVPRSQLPIVPDGISLSRFLALTPRVKTVLESQRLFEKDVVAVTPARLVPRKRLEFGVEIVAALKRQGQSVRWLVTGAPDACNVSGYQEDIVRLVKRLKVEDEIVFLGAENGKPVWISDEDVQALYAVSDALIFASQQEGFGIPVLEGALARNILVLSRIPVLREIASKDSGCDVVWVPEKGAKRRGSGLETMGMKAADRVARQLVKRLYQSPEVRFRKRVMSHYSWSVILREILEPMVNNPKAFWPDR